MFFQWNPNNFVSVVEPMLLAQTKVATIFGIFPLVVVVVLTRLPFTPEGTVVGF